MLQRLLVVRLPQYVSRKSKSCLCQLRRKKQTHIYTRFHRSIYTTQHSFNRRIPHHWNKSSSLHHLSRRNITGAAELGALAALHLKSILAGVSSIAGLVGIWWYLSVDEDDIYDTSLLDLELIAHEIRDALYHPDYDEGCAAPLILRLAFNQAATFSRYDGLGGTNGASLRLEPELTYDHNNGLAKGMAVLEPVKSKFPRISYSDLWVLASYVAIEEMGGPSLQFKPGRIDLKPPSADNPMPELAVDRFPEWDQGATRLLDWFDRLGLSDREGVCLMGGHSCGRLHEENSGISGTWTDSQILTSDYYKNTKYVPYVYERRGKEHYFDPAQPDMVLLPIEGCFFYGARLMRWSEFYAIADPHIWLEDFGEAWQKITELGCDFAKPLHTSDDSIDTDAPDIGVPRASPMAQLNPLTSTDPPAMRDDV